MTYSIGSLCSGAGMLDVAASVTLGDARKAWVCETDTEASRVLAERFGVPNHGDIRSVDWSTVEPVDVLVAGYPCQDFSNAGRRAGMEGDRGALWFDVARAVGVLRPRLVCLENVDAHVVRGFREVLGDLASLGYDATWTTLRASDVGAPHQRNRLFVVAADPDREPVRLQPEPERARQLAAVAGGDSPRALMPTPTASVADRGGMPAPSREGGNDLREAIAALLPTPVARDWKGAGYAGQLGTALLPTPRATEGAKGGPNQRGSSGDLTLTSSVMLLPTPRASDGAPATSHGRTWSATDNNLHNVAREDRWAQYGGAIARWEAVLGRPAPDPTVTGKRGGRRLSGRFAEFLMGWPDGWVTDLVDNTAALRICGNGVVPQCASAAYWMLMEMSA